MSDNINLIKKKLRLSPFKKIGMCHGVFDLLHYGHILHFEEAKKKCDILVVSVTSDRFVKKGPGRPYYNLHTRMQSLKAIKYIDYVIESDHPTAEKNLKELRPNIFFKGPDYKNTKTDITKNILTENKLAKKIGSKIYLTTAKTFSSSNIINKFSKNLSNEQKIFIKKIKKETSFEDIKTFIENFKKLKVLVIGEIIIDQYIFSDTIGKSGKEPYLVMRPNKTEQYAGGSLAVARNLSNFCKEIKILSYVGKDFLSYKQSLKSSINKNVKFDLILKKNSPSIVKKRILDNYTNAKILGIYDYNDEFLSSNEEKILLNKLKKNEKNYDLIINIDYGHGLLSPKIVNYLNQSKKFVALNAQVNSSNRGYHGLFKYKNPNLTIINELELRYELRNKSEKIEMLLDQLSKKIKSKLTVVTRGKYGSTLKKNNLFFSCPGFADKIVDKVGAGDTMLALISLCLYKKSSENVALLISSLAASQSVSSYNNSFPVDKNDLLKSIKYLMA